ncbi:uncharacterized protein N7459_000221 [Penicillium hispanicum]|uniref:uncharacterized protein n=1 Tax=Penicillium hispanicum TaxID=1080232 RepID=UPI0025408E1B|nr:uncharacterized protein N7459_000221 [Penicillium hispanicum]KAJ5594013.1 hypothetical protein N7459_000221 [Penicillium hispanicum]
MTRKESLDETPADIMRDLDNSGIERKREWARISFCGSATSRRPDLAFPTPGDNHTGPTNQHTNFHADLVVDSTALYWRPNTKKGLDSFRWGAIDLRYTYTETATAYVPLWRSIRNEASCMHFPLSGDFSDAAEGVGAARFAMAVSTLSPRIELETIAQARRRRAGQTKLPSAGSTILLPERPILQWQTFSQPFGGGCNGQPRLLTTAFLVPSDATCDLWHLMVAVEPEPTAGSFSNELGRPLVTFLLTCDFISSAPWP